MSRLIEIETAAAALPSSEQEELLTWLALRVKQDGSRSNGHSVLDITPVNLGEVLKPMDDGYDLLGEMLEGRV